MQAAVDLHDAERKHHYQQVRCLTADDVTRRLKKMAGKTSLENMDQSAFLE